MKIERLSHDKIRIFLTFDDLSERGIQKDDIWREIPKVHDLFNELLDHAYSELGFDSKGPLAVEVFAMPAQGMVVVVTKGKHGDGRNAYEEEFDDDVYEMEVTLEESDLISYTFRDFEHVVEAARRIGPHYTDGGKLFAYKGCWILQLEFETDDDKKFDNLISILSEYGEANSLTDAVLSEYGKVVIPENAIGTIRSRFS